MSSHSVKSVSSKSSHSAASAPKAPASNHATQAKSTPSHETKTAEQTATKATEKDSDLMKLSDEAQALRNDGATTTTDHTKPLKQDDPTTEVTKPAKEDDPAATDADGDGKPDEPQDGKETDDKQKQLDELKALLEEMQKLQEEKDKLKNKQPPEDLGGCCGKSHGSKKTGDQGNQDPNQVLLSDIAAVHLERAGGKVQGATGAQGAANAGAKTQAGAKGVNGVQGVNGAQGGGSAVAKLASDYEGFKSQGAQIRPEVEQQVQAILGGGTGTAQPTNGAAGAKQAGQTGQVGQATTTRQ